MNVSVGQALEFNGRKCLVTALETKTRTWLADRDNLDGLHFVRHPHPPHILSPNFHFTPYRAGQIVRECYSYAELRPLPLELGGGSYQLFTNYRMEPIS